MGDCKMKTTTFLAWVIVTSATISLGTFVMAQQPDATAQEPAGVNDSAKTTYRPAYSGWGNAAASHAWEMSSITGELEGKLDSKTAKPGDRVVLKTTDKVQTSDGTLIPKGSRLIGHVTEVQACDATHAIAQMGIAFDHVELKGGQSVAIFTLIHRLYPGRSAIDTSGNSMAGGGPMDSSMDASMGGGSGGRMGGSQSSIGGGRAGGGGMGSPGGTLNGAGGLPGGAGTGTGNGTGSIDDRANAGIGANPNGAVESAGLGDDGISSGAHAAAAARARPRPSGFPGVMLAGNSTASGLLIATKQNIQFESGTEIQLGIVAD